MVALSSKHLLAAAEKEIIQHKLQVSTGQYTGDECPSSKHPIYFAAIFAPYGAFDKEGNRLAKPGDMIGSVAAKLSESQIDLPSVCPKVIEYLTKKIKGYMGKEHYGIDPLIRVQHQWQYEEMQNSHFGHLFQPFFKLEEIPAELKEEIPYYVQVIKIALIFARTHLKHYPDHLPSLTHIYADGPNPYRNQLEPNGGMGVIGKNYHILLTPWGEFTIDEMTPRNIHVEHELEMRFLLETILPPIDNPWDFRPNTHFSISKGLDGKEKPDAILKPQQKYLPYREVKEKWRKIRDFVFREAVIEQ
jgi:hypothetical protein